MLYAIKFSNGKWGLVDRKRVALRVARDVGGEVWARVAAQSGPIVIRCEASAWDWPTFVRGARRIY